MKRGIPDFLIEQLYLDELDPQLKEKLLAEPEVVRRVEELAASNAEILDSYPPAEMARRIQTRMAAAREEGPHPPVRSDAKQGNVRPVLVRIVQWKGFVPALAAAAVFAILIGVVPLLTQGGGSPGTSTEIRIKGAGPVLHVYRETANGIERLRNGERVQAHDLLQLSYIAEGQRFGMVFSIDGSGTITLHFPERSRRAAPLKNAGEIALSHSYELDNAPNFERFYFVTSNSEFPVDEILNIARRAVTSGTLSSLTFPREFKVADFTVSKETKR